MIRVTLRSAVTGCRRVPARQMSDYFKKNTFVEENAGLREITYRTWEFNPTTLSRLAALLFIPSFLYFHFVIKEFEARNKNIEVSRKYGMLPPTKEN